MLQRIYTTWLGDVTAAGYDTPEEHLEAMRASMACATRHADGVIFQTEENFGEIPLPLNTAFRRIERTRYPLWALEKMHAVADAFAAHPDPMGWVAHMDLDFYLFHLSKGCMLNFTDPPSVVVQCRESVWDHYARGYSLFGMQFPTKNPKPFCAGFLATNRPHIVAENIYKRIEWALEKLGNREPEDWMNYHFEQGELDAYMPRLRYWSALGGDNAMTHHDWIHLIRRHRGSSVLRSMISLRLPERYQHALLSSGTTSYWPVSALVDLAALGTHRMVLDLGSDALSVYDHYLHPCPMRVQAQMQSRPTQRRFVRPGELDPASRKGFPVPELPVHGTIFTIESQAALYPVPQLWQVIHNVVEVVNQQGLKNCELWVPYNDLVPDEAWESTAFGHTRNLLGPTLGGRSNPLYGFQVLRYHASPETPSRGVARVFLDVDAAV